MICFRKMSLSDKELKTYKKSKRYAYQKGEAELKQMNLADLKTHKGEVTKDRDDMKSFVERSKTMPSKRKALYNNYIRLTTEYINTIESYISKAKKDPEKKAKDCTGKIKQLDKDLARLAKIGRSKQAKVTKCTQQGTSKCSREKYNRFEEDLKKHKKLVEEKTQEKTNASAFGTCFQPNLKF